VQVGWKAEKLSWEKKLRDWFSRGSLSVLFAIYMIDRNFIAVYCDKRVEQQHYCGATMLILVSAPFWQRSAICTACAPTKQEEVACCLSINLRLFGLLLIKLSDKRCQAALWRSHSRLQSQQEGWIMCTMFRCTTRTGFGESKDSCWKRN